MKTQAKIPTKKAVCIAGKTAKNNILPSKHYQKDKPLSSLKMRIGEILLLLITGNEQPGDWRGFERLLRQFYKRGTS